MHTLWNYSFSELLEILWFPFVTSFFMKCQICDLTCNVQLWLLQGTGEDEATFKLSHQDFFFFYFFLGRKGHHHFIRKSNWHTKFAEKIETKFQWSKNQNFQSRVDHLPLGKQTSSTWDICVMTKMMNTANFMDKSSWHPLLIIHNIDV